MEGRLRTWLVRGGVIAAANWPTVVAQFAAESIVKVLAGLPLAAAAALVVVLSIPDAGADTTQGGDVAAALAALATEPAALAAVVASAIVAGLGGLVFGAVVKAGTVAVIVAGERRARPRLARPLRATAVLAARAWSPARFRGGCRRFGRRFVVLALLLGAIDAALALGYAVTVVQAYRAFVSLAASWWIPAAMLGVSVVALAASSAADLVYRLAQLVVAVDDAPVRGGLAGAVAFLRRAPLPIARIWVAAVILSTVVLIGSLVAAAAIGPVSFVPVVGIVVWPLQGAVWIVRGLLLPFIELAALAAYVMVYRQTASSPAALAEAWPAERPGQASA
jgi:hypothetical protein